MELKILGSGCGTASEGRHTSCYFIKDLNIFLDFGSGFFRAKPLLKGVDKISILLSHLHHDHIRGIPSLFEIFGGSEADIFVPKGTKDDVYRYCEPPYFPIPMPTWKFRTNLIETSDRFRIGDVAVETRSFDHFDGESTSFRLSDGEKTLVYMTDTRSAGKNFDEAVEFARDADCLMHEANFLDRQKDLAVQYTHTTALEAAEVAKAANVGMLLMCHLGTGEPKLFEEEARRLFKSSHAALEKETYII